MENRSQKSVGVPFKKEFITFQIWLVIPYSLDQWIVHLPIYLPSYNKHSIIVYNTLKHSWVVGKVETFPKSVTIKSLPLPKYLLNPVIPLNLQLLTPVLIYTLILSCL